MATEVQHRNVATNGISLHVAEQGSGRPVVLCHGFPELWYSYRHQLPALAAAGYHAIAPDMRGYGRSDAPARVEDYDIDHLTGDLAGLLDAMGEDKAVFVGHDWGALVVWQMALLHPGRVEAVVGLSVPYSPRGAVAPTQGMKAVFGDNFFYILYFQKVGPADAELARDPHRSVRNTLCGISGEGALFTALPKDGTGFLDLFADPETLPAWLRDEDVDYFAREFERTGFTGGLNYYRNFDRNWELHPELEGRKVEQPSLFVAGSQDPVIRMSSVDTMKSWTTDLRDALILEGAGHWTQQERPDEVNRALTGFLATL